MTIMGIDDPATMRKIINMGVKEEHDFIEAENGQDALNKLEDQPKLDAFIVDVNMPVMGGIEFIKNVRAVPAYNKTPIIIITTESDQNMKDEGIKAGANAWIVKPFEKEQLQAVLASL